MYRSIALLSVIAMATALFFGMNSPAAEKGADHPDNPFAGKLVAIYVDGQDAGTAQILEDVEIKDIGGRKMLVGIGADTQQEENWTTGVRIGITWDSVEQYYAMTEEQFQEKIATHFQ